MNKTPELLVVIRKLLESQKLGILATRNHGQPYSNYNKLRHSGPLEMAGPKAGTARCCHFCPVW